MNLYEKLSKNIARSVCLLTGSTKPYKRIRKILRGARQGKGAIRYPGLKGVNCHGAVFYFTGIDSSETPRYIDAKIMDSFLQEGCFIGTKDNSVIAAFREADDNSVGHTAICIPGGNLLFHQRDISKEIEITTLENLLEEDSKLRCETNLEFYKIIPEKLWVPSYLTNA